MRPATMSRSSGRACRSHFATCGWSAKSSWTDGATETRSVPTWRNEASACGAYASPRSSPPRCAPSSARLHDSVGRQLQNRLRVDKMPSPLPAVMLGPDRLPADHFELATLDALLAP